MISYIDDTRIYQLLARAGSGTRSIWIQSFPSSRMVAIPRLKSVIYLFAQSRKDNNWIHAFPNSISVMWKAKSLVQDLN